MNRIQGIDTLKNVDIREFFTTNNQYIIKMINSNSVAKKMLAALEEIVPNIQKLQHHKPDYRVKYFQFSSLRTKLLYKDMGIILHAFDANWYLDEDSVSIEFSFSEFEEILEQLYIHLLSVRNKRSLAIENFDIHNLIMETGVNLAQMGFVSFAAYLEYLDYPIQFLSSVTQVEFEIRGGEYKGTDTILYKGGA